MKRIWVVIVNILIMFSMLTFVFIYSTLESRDMTQRQIEHFESTTVTMEHVTENYLEGEQRICDVWAHYINKEQVYDDILKWIQSKVGWSYDEWKAEQKFRLFIIWKVLVLPGYFGTIKRIRFSDSPLNLWLFIHYT